MTPVLLPDDPHAADQVVRLMNDKHALLTALRRMREERDYWRERYFWAEREQRA